MNHASVDLQVRDNNTADVEMSIGGTSESVEVSSEAPLIDTTAAVSGRMLRAIELAGKLYC